MKKEFDVLGMTCSSCSAHVDRAVRRLDGVNDVSVNLISNSMVVDFDEKKLNIEDIIASVKKAGYDAKEKKKEKNIDNISIQIKNMKKRVIISFIFLIPLMYLAMYHMFYEWFNLPIPNIIMKLFYGPENALVYAISQLILLLPIVIVNIKYFINGFKRLFMFSPNMDSLIAIGSSAGIVYGIFSIIMILYNLKNGNMDAVSNYSMKLYFESSGTILTLITFGKYLEAKSKGKTNDAIKKLVNLAPKTAIVLKNNKEIETKVENILCDDIILIKPGGSIPVDGVVIDGESYVDEAMVTGESMPVSKKIGDSCICGTINKNGVIKIKATKVGDDTTLAQIIKLVEEASNSKAPISKLADKVSLVFVPVVIAIAIISCIVWLLLGYSFEFALTTLISVLVISCPCALGLATPVAIMVGTGKAAEQGIIIKSAESLETMHLVNTVIFDKTGTITEEKLKVEKVVPMIDEKELLKIAGSLEKNSEHPISLAIVSKVEKENIEFEKVEEFSSISGRGVKGKINGKLYFAGNLNFMRENNIDIKNVENIDEVNTCVYFANEFNVIGLIFVADTIKDTSKTAVEYLRHENIDVFMITGDNKKNACYVAKKVGIKNVIAEVLPQDKEKEVEKLQKLGKKVAFVGDGINDSPALTLADVGVSIGNGTDIAIESADIVLVKNNLLDVVRAIKLSKAVIKNIKMNLFWAFFYNIIGIPIAAGVFYLSFGLSLNPMIGALAMSFSSVCVVTNALRLRRFKVNFKEEKNMEFVKTIYIDNMSCNHCKMTVEKTLSQIDGVVEVSVSLEDKKAVIKSNKEIDDSVIIKEIEEVGFDVNKIV